MTNISKKWLMLIWIAFAATLLSNCGTVAPKAIVSHEASFDGSTQNSGIISPVKSPEGWVTGYLVTPHFRARYNALIARFGNRFTPEVKTDDGIAQFGGEYRIDNEHLVNFLDMNEWSKADPKKTLLEKMGL